MRSSRCILSVVTLTATLLFTGCGPSKEELQAQERARLELEERQRREAEMANKAITDMTDRAFRRRTPEEEAKHQAEKARQVQELLDAQKKADAEAEKPKP